MISKDDINELKQLQKELLNAKPDGTRDPRLFILMEPQKTYGLSPQWGCDCLIRRKGEEEPLLDDAMPQEKFEETCKKLFKETGCKGYRLWKLRCADVYQILENEEADADYELVGYENALAPNMNRVFFTRKAANEYLVKSGYNHPNGTKSYSVFPDERCKEWHLVAKLLREADFDKLLK